jgi:hypothetical protein
MKHLIYLLFILLPLSVQAWQVRGLVSDQRNMPVPYASVYVENSTYGVATNAKGEYLMNLNNGTYTLVFQAVGYIQTKVEVVVNGQNLRRNVTLPQNARLLEAITIEANKEDPAYPIIRNAIAARKENDKAASAFSCEVYSKISREKEFMVHDTLSRKARDTIENKLAKERMNFVESKSTLYFQQPNQWKEIKHAVKDLDAGKSEGEAGVIVQGYGDEISYGGEAVNRTMFKTNLSEGQFNFYESLMSLPNVGQVPFSSPIGSAAFLNYKFKLESTFYEDGFWINKIAVQPKRKFAALYDGYIYITDSVWSIKAVDLVLDKSELLYFSYMRIFQEYAWVNDSIWLIDREEFFYETKDFQVNFIGNTNIVYDDYNLNPSFPKRFFGNELLRIEDDAYDKDLVYWDSIRPIDLKEEELAFVEEQDSIDQYQETPAYKHEQDSTVNHISFWDVVLNGVYHQNSFKKTKWNVISLIEQLQPLGVGGYRHALGGSFTKELPNATKYKVRGILNYGFTNHDLRGEVGVDYTYLPKHFGRFHAEYRNNYEMLNTFASVQTIFSRSNYVQDIFYSLGHDIEVINGVYADLTVEFGEKLPIKDLQLSDWSNELFGGFNTPVDFEPYREFGIDLRVKLTPFQKYQMKPNRKVVLGSDWPSFTIWYKKGVPGVFRSVSNLDFLQIKADHDIQVGTFGTSKWRVMAGSYLNDKNVQIADYKFFRRSDPYWFSNPLLSFQLLRPDGAAVFTTKPYFQANYLHNFEGSLMNKVPFIRRLGLQAVGGAAILLLDENNIRHAEAFGGIEFPFRIKEQLFKVGTYYTIGQSNLTNFSGEIKFGIDFFNDFTNKWSY